MSDKKEVKIYRVLRLIDNQGEEIAKFINEIDAIKLIDYMKNLNSDYYRVRWYEKVSYEIKEDYAMVETDRLNKCLRHWDEFSDEK